MIELKTKTMSNGKQAKWLEIPREGKGPVRIGPMKCKAVIDNMAEVSKVLDSIGVQTFT